MRILFVCLGNICRSPTAHAVFAHKLAQRGLSDRIEVDSCGTSGYHPGEAPDRRAVAAAAKRGYDLSGLRARQVTASDFQRSELILAMDRANLEQLEQRRGNRFTGELGLFLACAPGLGVDEVPDPFFGQDDGFAYVLDLIEAASDALIERLQRDAE